MKVAPCDMDEVHTEGMRAPGKSLRILVHMSFCGVWWLVPRPSHETEHDTLSTRLVRTSKLEPKVRSMGD